MIVLHFLVCAAVVCGSNTSPKAIAVDVLPDPLVVDGQVFHSDSDGSTVADDDESTEELTGDIEEGVAHPVDANGPVALLVEAESDLRRDNYNLIVYGAVGAIVLVTIITAVAIKASS